MIVAPKYRLNGRFWPIAAAQAFWAKMTATDANPPFRLSA